MNRTRAHACAGWGGGWGGGGGLVFGRGGWLKPIGAITLIYLRHGVA